MDGKQENSLKRAWRRSGRKKSCTDGLPAGVRMSLYPGFYLSSLRQSGSCRGKVSHTLFEKEFDRMLMYETGKDPLRFYPSHGIRASFLSAWTIHQVLPAIRTWNIYLSLKMMKIFTCILVCDDGGRKRRLSEHALSPAGKRDLRLLPNFL